MSKDYDTLKYIKEEMEDVDEKIISTVCKMFNRLSERRCYASCLSTSVILYLAFRYLGLEPKIILGKLLVQGFGFQHVWVELNDKIYDLAIHFDTKYHPVFIENEFKEEKPVVNANYNDLNLKYLKWTFDDTWVMTNLYKMVGKTLEEYIDEAPVDDLFRDACYILDISETKDNLDKLREISKEVKISDKEP